MGVESGDHCTIIASVTPLFNPNGGGGREGGEGSVVVGVGEVGGGMGDGWVADAAPVDVLLVLLVLAGAGMGVGTNTSSSGSNSLDTVWYSATLSSVVSIRSTG
jgi:hypothetical protein